MPWRKGTSGNARGRPLGTNHIGKLRASLAKHVPEIIAAMVEAAKGGDTAAAKLILERAIPALRPEERPIQLDGFSGARIELVAAVIEAIADGRVDLGRGGRFIATMAPSLIEERIAELERKSKLPPLEGKT